MGKMTRGQALGATTGLTIVASSAPQRMKETAGSITLTREPRLPRGPKMDIVFLHGLKIETVIGAFDWERRIEQTVVLDLDLGFDIRGAAASDNLGDALNYKAVAKRLTAFVGAGQFHLVETLAERVAELLLEEFPIDWLRLRVNKPGAVRGARDVGVLIERGVRT
jgi:dihydroneopterin aldolase